MTVKKIVCLANSRKLAGRCLAGKVVGGSPSRWIRPVSSRPHEEVSEYERQYEDGSDPQVLDVVSVPLVEQRPKNYQQENWLLNPEYYWRKEGTVAWADLANFVEGDEKLWINDRRPVFPQFHAPHSAPTPKPDPILPISTRRETPPPPTAKFSLVRAGCTREGGARVQSPRLAD